MTKDAGLGAYWGENGDQTWADAYDSLVDKIKRSTDPAERAALCAQAEKILMATGGVAPLYYYTNPYMLKPNVQNTMILHGRRHPDLHDDFLSITFKGPERSSGLLANENPAGFFRCEG